jgi:hypothetical protein
VAADTLIQIQNHGNLRFNLHTSPPFLPFGLLSLHLSGHLWGRSS